jgi:hypothetical protein
MKSRQSGFAVTAQIGDGLFHARRHAHFAAGSA